MDEIKTDDLTGHENARRRFLAAAASVAAAPLLPANAAAATAGRKDTDDAPRGAAVRRSKSGRPNVLFVFTDQERYIKAFPNGLVLEGHERLKRRGVSFESHYCPAVMCTSSRAVLLTGLQTPDNGMFENADMPYVKAMSTTVPTIGHMLRKAGYYTAYKGKWHLDHDFDTRSPEKVFAPEMDAYGFSDFGLPVDGLAHALGGYRRDHEITGGAIAWMREKGQQLNTDGKPWSLFVSLVNPHDIMYFNTDRPGESAQDNGKLMMRSSRAPDHPLYRKQWHAPLPGTLRQAIDAPGRPRAHAEFNRAWGYTLGSIPMENERWDRFNDFYFNSLRSVDMQLVRLLDELDALGLTENTIVMFTSDHGEMGGAHGLRGKGPFAYQEAIHLPLIIAHPDVGGSKQCKSLTGHIDIVPTVLSLCGVSADQAGQFAGRSLPGKDFSGALGDPARAGLHAVRDSVLFTYSGLATNDSELVRLISEAREAGKDPKTAVRDAGYRPNLKKRGSLRCVFDGRYKFTRYFSPLDRNRPHNLDELYRWNDLELFDLQQDPAETKNLAMTKGENAALVATMSEKLEAIIKVEIGTDDGREMPKVEGIDWGIDQMDL